MTTTAITNATNTTLPTTISNMTHHAINGDATIGIVAAKDVVVVGGDDVLGFVAAGIQRGHSVETSSKLHAASSLRVAFGVVRDRGVDVSTAPAAILLAP